MAEEGLWMLPDVYLKAAADILRQVIEEYAEDARVGEPKRQLGLIEAEMERRRSETCCEQEESGKRRRGDAEERGEEPGGEPGIFIQLKTGEMEAKRGRG